MTTEKVLFSFVELAKKYRDLSRKYYGWNTAYVDLTKMELTDNYESSSQYRFYFAADGDHTAVTVNFIEVDFYPDPEIVVRASQIDHLEELYNQAYEHFVKIEANMADKELHREQDEKKQRIEILKNQIKELETE